jgi:hypothetical protein
VVQRGYQPDQRECRSHEPYPLWSGRASSRSRLALRRLIVSPTHGDRRPQRKQFAVDHRLQQFTRSSFRGLAFTDRDQHSDRQSVDPPIPFLPFRRCPTWASNPARRTPTADPSDTPSARPNPGTPLPAHSGRIDCVFAPLRVVTRRAAGRASLVIGDAAERLGQFLNRQGRVRGLAGASIGAPSRLSCRSRCRG